MESRSARAFRDLIVWQKAHQFVLDTYMYTNKFPKEEIYELIKSIERKINNSSNP